METAITPIVNIFDSQAVRFITTEEGHTLVNANDVMKVLGYSQPRRAWFEMKPIVESYFGSVRTFGTLTKTGTYDMSYLDQDQLFTLLVKSDKPMAKPFFKWVIELVKREVKAQVVKDEAYFHNLILRYADYSTIKFRSEMILDNNITNDPGDNSRSRRTDLIRVLPRCVQVWEIKAHAINERDISQTIAYKGYLSLIAKRFPNKPIDFRFTSPYGIDPSGQRYLDITGYQDEYKEVHTDGITYRCKLRFQPLQDLALEIKNNILRNTPVAHRYQISKFFDPNFADILTSSQQPLASTDNVIQFPNLHAAA